MSPSTHKYICEKCKDTGWARSTDQLNSYVRCSCYYERLGEILYNDSNLPKGLRELTLDKFIPDRLNKLKQNAWVEAMDYCEHYGVEEEKGLLLEGSFGTGKTHLAVGIITELITRKHIPCLFWDFALFLNRLKGTFDRDSDIRQQELMRPIMETEVLLLDDLGAEQMTDWVTDTLGIIVNYRYMNKKPLIITTNYLDDPETLAHIGAIDKDDRELHKEIASHNAKRGRTLAQRIGGRLRSRLYEICKTVVILGEDYRKRQRD
jgi:DNA replication protein DnaC